MLKLSLIFITRLFQALTNSVQSLTQFQSEPKNLLPFQCLNPAWSLNVDMQLFIVSPIFLFGLWKIGYAFFSICLAVIGASCFSVFQAVVKLSLNMFNVSFAYFEHIYFKTHARCGPWFVGLMMGYVLYRRHNLPSNVRKVRLP